MVKPKKLIQVRLNHQQLEFLQNYGEGITQQLENALERLEKLEQNNGKVTLEADKKKQQQLNFLKEKERIKTEAAKERQKLREHVRVNWGDSYVDTDSFYKDEWGDNF